MPPDSPAARVAHPRDALHSGERPIPAIPACEHIAGSEKLIAKSFALQEAMPGLVDVTCDCEDGAEAGQETRHAHMVVELLRARTAPGRVGVRVHDGTHPHWQRDVEIVVGAAADRLAYVTLPKCTSAAQAAGMIAFVQECAAAAGRPPLPIHVLVETHGALREAWDIAALPHVETLDFGLMDFVSAHHGAIAAANMRSPGQFEHPLLVRAKTEIVAAALAHGVVPAHNVSLELRDAARVREDARRARHALGFLRMWSIHPSQVQPIVEAMQPQADEVEDAARILLAARAAHWGPIRDGNELHDRASYRYYWQVLEKARTTGVAIPPAAASAFFPASAAAAESTR